MVVLGYERHKNRATGQQGTNLEWRHRDAHSWITLWGLQGMHNVEILQQCGASSDEIGKYIHGYRPDLELVW
jgi:hypothetical protein